LGDLGKNIILTSPNTVKVRSPDETPSVVIFARFLD
jgi:hypothetical protein